LRESVYNDASKASVITPYFLHKMIRPPNEKYKWPNIV